MGEKKDIVFCTGGGCTKYDIFFLTHLSHS